MGTDSDCDCPGRIARYPEVIRRPAAQWTLGGDYRRSAIFGNSVLARPGHDLRRRWFTVEVQSVRLPVGGPSSLSFLTSSPETIPNRPSVMIIDLTLTSGSAAGPTCPHLGHLITGVRMDRVERM